VRQRLGRGEFAKYHALGNDYLVVDPRRLGFKLTPSRIRALCDRHVGVGSDGILALAPSRTAQFGLRIFNPDGSEAEKSGNGLRIFARFLHDHGYTDRTNFRIATKGGQVDVALTLRQGSVHWIRVAMGRATFVSSNIPVRGRRREVVDEELATDARRFRITCVSVGNPHCVIFVAHLDVDVLRRFGPLIERHRQFPNRINVQFAQVRSRRVIDALIWERGAGETMASGSSSCAIAAAAVRRGLADRHVTIKMPGGSLAIEVGDDWALNMSGPATPVYRGSLC